MMSANNYPLRSLFWEATLRCNARCEFCGSRCGENNQRELKKAELSKEEICSCFKEIAQRYNPEEIMLNVTGGEPLLRADLFDVMSYASALGFPWGMVTNGSLITEVTIQKMRQTKMRTISISLDGLPQTHNRLRKLNDGFKKVETAVKLLKEADFLKEIQITMVVNHENIGEIDELFPYIVNMGADSWRLAMVDPIGRAKDNKDLFLSKDELKMYFGFFKKYQFNGKVALTTSCSHFLGEADNLYRTHPFFCATSKTVASVLYNGDIFVCPNVERRPELIQGNIKETSFCDVWENGFKWFRDDNSHINDTCAKCEYSGKCKGDSTHTWDFENNRPRFCWKEKNPFETKGNSDFDLIERIKPYCGHLKRIKISYGSSSYWRAIFLPKAAEELRKFFEWGNNPLKNCRELSAGLIGHIKDEVFIIEKLISVNLKNCDENEAALSEKDYNELINELKIINARRTNSDEKYRFIDGNYRLIGIAYTHTDRLKTTMSLPDRELHKKAIDLHTEFLSVILNPHAKQICAYSDSVYSPIDIEILTEDPQKWGII